MNIDDLIEQIEFKSKKIFKDKRTEDLFYYASGRINNQPVFLKIISKEKFFKRCEFHYKREVCANQIFGLADKEQNIKISRLKVLDHGETDKYFWLVREFVGDEPLCVSEDNFNDINTSYLNNFAEITKDICRMLKMIKKISTENFDQKYFSRFITEISIDQAKECEDLGINTSAIAELFEKNKDQYFFKKNICLGDLNPRNILVSRELTVRFFDFEWLSVDNPLVDLSFIWFFLYKNKQWQEKLIQNYELKNEEKLDFQISLIRVILSVDGGLHKGESKDFALKVLRAAGESFEAIMNVK